MAHDILIVDDEADIRDLVAGILQDEGYQTRVARDADSAFKEIEARRPSLLVLDVWLLGSRLDGIEILRQVKRDHPELPVVMISGHGTIETAVGAIKVGAYDFIEKPFKTDRLLLVIERALEAAKLRRENQELRLRAGVDGELLGQSAAINLVRQTIDKVAPTGSRVLITGPAGSGKEIVARLLHARSRRADGPFIALNAAMLDPDRVEAELFGIEGAGDTAPRVGVFEQAHGGTLFLDEVADMPIETQGRIVRVLVDQTFERVGGSTRVQVDVRVISSSSRDLRAEIDARRFREDLFHRLNVVPVRVPGLAERRDDIPALAAYFMAHLSQTSGLAERRIGDDAMAALQSHDWPGNVRQLRNIVERMLILASDDVQAAITADMLPPEVGMSQPNVMRDGAREHVMSLPLRDAREVFERDYLLAQVTRFGGNISRTAAFVGMERSALHRKLKSLGVQTGNRGLDLTD
jgi:two-component system nitrogen regulation response regulator NtrX